MGHVSNVSHFNTVHLPWIRKNKKGQNALGGDLEDTNLSWHIHGELPKAKIPKLIRDAGLMPRLVVMTVCKNIYQLTHNTGTPLK